MFALPVCLNTLPGTQYRELLSHGNGVPRFLSDARKPDMTIYHCDVRVVYAAGLDCHPAVSGGGSCLQQCSCADRADSHVYCLLFKSGLEVRAGVVACKPLWLNRRCLRRDLDAEGLLSHASERV